MDVKELKAERNQLFMDVFDSVIPKRVPMGMEFPVEPLIEYGKVDLFEGQWDLGKIEEAAEKLSKAFYSDAPIFQGAFRVPSHYQILNSQSFVMGSNGFIQHPEVVGMLSEDYDEVIESPYDCIIEKILPRQYKALDPSNPGAAMLNLAKAAFAWAGDMEISGSIVARINEKHGFADFTQMGSVTGGFTEAPFDYLADQLRSFKGISMDIRRMPEKVSEACDALYPIVKKMGMPMVMHEYSTVSYPLHMPTFMKEKDFAKLWWPSFKRLCDDYASMGIRNSLFCENDWMRYLDYLQELPANSILYFEYGDAKEIKRRLGNRHIITGLYPLTYLKTHTKQECIDLAKKYLDDLAPGGKYIFSFDKSPLSIKDINMDNLKSVMDTVKEYGVYSNPGEQSGDIYRKEDYTAQTSRTLESKYYRTWEQYKEEHPTVSDFAAEKLQGLEELMFTYITLGLLV